jgi:tetratricopeptide (TPR) repeat protein
MRPLGLLADALRYAHAKGVVHRDIKASNVLLDSRGAPYLVDFGVAAIPGEARDARGGATVNASPQQRAGQAAQPADDIFALGVLMHELLTGLPPSRSAGEPLNAQLPDGSAVPTALSALLNDMLSDEAATRPSAEEVAERLHSAGFAAGPVPGRYLRGSADAGSEIIDSVQSIQPVHRAARPAGDAAALQEAASGVSPKILFRWLAGTLAIFLIVIYGLPAMLSLQPDDAAGGLATDDTLTEAEAASSGTEPAVQGGKNAAFGENITTEFGSDGARVKAATDEALGDLLSRLERLRYRAIDRWGGQPYLDAVDVYAQGDVAYLARNYALAGDHYRKATQMLEPFLERIDEVFADSLAAATDAFAVADASEAVRLYDLAVAITPGHRAAEAGLARALTLESVLGLTGQGVRFEKDLELDAAKLAFEKALEIDALWEPAAAGLTRVRESIKQMSFDLRMTEGLNALTASDFASAKAAFNAAKLLQPASRQPADGLLQVDQGIRLANIQRLELEAAALDDDEQWEVSIPVYKEILGIDADLQFAKTGLANANSRSALHNRIQGLIEEPDTLSDPVTMQSATRLLLDMARVSPMGPRLEDQKSELSRLLKRAATPLRVQLISDNATDVAIFKVGKFGTFSNWELELRPGVYVAVGNRIGFRDVRLEFRVAPEIEMKPIVIQCEERI